MSQNKKVVENHLTDVDRERSASALADDVEWVEWGDGVPPTGVITRGKDAYIKNSGDDVLRTEIRRIVEEGDVVVCEGVVHVTKPDGRTFNVQFCDLFDMDKGKIKRKTSYAVLLKDSP